MNIALIGTGQHNIPPTGYGAVERHIHELARQLANNGNSVFVVNKNFGNEYRFIPWAMKELQRIKLDVIHAHTSAVGLAISLLHDNLIFTSHNPSWTYQHELDGRNKIGLKIEKFIAKRNHFITLNTQTFKKVSLIAKCPHLIYGAIDAKRWKQSDFSGGYALSVGKFDPRKGYHLVVPEHFQYIIAGHSVGNTQYEMDLQNVGIDTRINPTNKELKELYYHASVFVHPSSFDAFSIAILEAMASGLPIIASKVCSDQIIDGTNGYIVKGTYYSGLIRKILDSETLIRFMGEASRTFVENTFSWENATNSLTKIYKEVAA